MRTTPSWSLVENTYAEALPELTVTWSAAVAPEPRLVVLNDRLADELGLDAAWLASADGVGALVGNDVPAGATPVALAYAGHQFGELLPAAGGRSGPAARRARRCRRPAPAICT